MNVEQVTGPVAFHGEGPVWSESWGGLRWVDMLAGDVLSLGPTARSAGVTSASVAAALRPRSAGGAVLGLERGFALEDADGAITELGELWTDANLRMNEGGCDPDGRFYCGSLAHDRRPVGSLYRLDPDLSVSVVLEGVTISNGLDWSPDGTRAYYNDTATFGIDVFDYDRETGLSGRRRFADTPELRPDGLTVDAEGGVWVAFANAGMVRRYGEDGAVEGVVELPVTKVTACAFGGARLDELYITTSKERIDTDAEPLAGSLFRADVGVTGRPVLEFAG